MSNFGYNRLYIQLSFGSSDFKGSSYSELSKPFYWDSPILGWLKIIIDSYSEGNPGIADCGGVFRNYREFVEGYFA